MDRLEKIRSLSNQDFALLGIEDVAYVKSVMVDGAKVYSVHAADGSEMAVMPDRVVAFAAVRQHDLEPVNVH